MELIIAEKPKVAKTIAYALGGTNIKQNRYMNISYFEFEKNGEKIVVAPAVGHLFGITEKTKSHNYPVFDIEWTANYKENKSAYYTKNYVEVLKKLGAEADCIVSACDYDLEGSLIAYNVFRFLCKAKDGKRMKFSSLVPWELREAYEKAEEFDYNNAYAGETRHIIDWYFGINLSRALMTAIKAAGRWKIMSIGRVQGPTLAILSELEKKIKAFKPKDYWEVHIKLKEIIFLHTQDRFTDEEAAKKSLSNTGTEAVIENVEKKEQKIWPLPAFDLTTLQTEAYFNFGFSPSKTLELAQTLYEGSLISYPRTASQKLPLKLGLDKIIEKIKSIEPYGDFAKKILENKWTKPFQGKRDDPAHPAIHPTGVKGKLEGDEKKLYDLIVRRFLGAFGPVGKKELVSIIADSNGEKYKTGGTRITEKGWIEFYEPYYKLKETELPEFKEGTKEKIEEKKKTKKQTQPPRRYSQATLLSELEKKHLGTKATRSVILDTLYKRNYIDGKNIQVTDFGLKVHGVIEKYAPEILDELLTKGIEEEMELIRDGKSNKDEMVKKLEDFLVKVLDKWKSKEAEIGKELAGALEKTETDQNFLGKCDKCGAMLRIIKMKFGKQFVGCGGYPNCRNAYPLPTGAFISPVKNPCKACGKPAIMARSKRKRYSMCIDPKCPSKEKWKKKGEINEKDK